MSWHQGNFQADPSCDILDGLDLSSCGLDCGPVSLRSADVSIEDVTELGCYPHADSGASRMVRKFPHRSFMKLPRNFFVEIRIPKVSYLLTLVNNTPVVVSRTSYILEKRVLLSDPFSPWLTHSFTCASMHTSRRRHSWIPLFDSTSTKR